jgi:hypothetical protein
MLKCGHPDEALRVYPCVIRGYKTRHIVCRICRTERDRLREGTSMPPIYRELATRPWR